MLLPKSPEPAPVSCPALCSAGPDNWRALWRKPGHMPRHRISWQRQAEAGVLTLCRPLFLLLLPGQQSWWQSRGARRLLGPGAGGCNGNSASLVSLLLLSRALHRSRPFRTRLPAHAQTRGGHEHITSTESRLDPDRAPASQRALFQRKGTYMLPVTKASFLHQNRSPALSSCSDGAGVDERRGNEPQTPNSCCLAV